MGFELSQKNVFCHNNTTHTYHSLMDRSLRIRSKRNYLKLLRLSC